MSLFRVTITRTRTMNGIKLEKGMSVEVLYGQKETNPKAPFLSQDGRDRIASAFMSKYGIDVKKVFAISSADMDSQIIG